MDNSFFSSSASFVLEGRSHCQFIEPKTRAFSICFRFVPNMLRMDLCKRGLT